MSSSALIIGLLVGLATLAGFVVTYEAPAEKLRNPVGKPIARADEFWIILHRANSSSAIERIRRLSEAHSNLWYGGKRIRWGAEIDVHYRDGEYYAAHSSRARGAERLTDLLKLLPQDSPVILELKSSMRKDRRVARLATTVEVSTRDIVALSFDLRIVDQLAELPELPSGLMTWQLSKNRRSAGAFGEFVARAVGGLGGLVREDLDVQVAAIPWYQISPDMLAQFDANAISIMCGTVEDAEALVFCLELQALGAFTDHPEQLAKSMIRRAEKAHSVQSQLLKNLHERSDERWQGRDSGGDFLRN